MKQRSGLCLVSLATLILATVAVAQLAPSPFTADIKMHSPRGEDMTGKFFYAGQRMRMDMDARGRSMSTITDLAGKKAYTLMHEQKMYMEHDLNQPRMGRGPRMPDIKPYDPTNPCANQEGTTCKKVGTETVNGRSCEKWEFYKDGQKQSTVWIDQKLHFPIKNVQEDGTTFEFTNIKEGAPPASTFDIPAGYQKFDMGGMMRGMGRDQ